MKATASIPRRENWTPNLLVLTPITETNDFIAEQTSTSTPELSITGSVNALRLQEVLGERKHRSLELRRLSKSIFQYFIPHSRLPAWKGFVMNTKEEEKHVENRDLTRT